MSQPSRAAQLQGLALSIAARQGGVQRLDNSIGRHYSEAVAVASRGVRPGDSIVVLGAGGSELCQALAQQVAGRCSVLLVDEDDKRLRQIASTARLPVEGRWSFVEGALDDLRTDPAELGPLLAESPAADLASYRRLQATLECQRRERPLVPDASRALVLLDGIANLLSRDKLKATVQEAFRVLHKGGSFVMCGLLLDEPLPSPGNDSQVGLLPLEKEAADIIADAGYHGISYEWRADLPWKIVDGVEVRAFVLHAYKGKQGRCIDQGHAVIYKGPWREVLDDDGHRYVRGERAAVCKKTFDLLNQAPYQGQFMGLVPYVLISEAEAPLFDCNTPATRPPAFTKGTKSVLDAREKAAGTAKDADCSEEGCC